MRRLLIALVLAATATSAHAKPKVFGQMPKAFQGHWCAINGEDPNSDYRRGYCHNINRPAVGAIRITPSGIDFHEWDCRLKYVYPASSGYQATFKCEHPSGDESIPVELVSFWIGLRGGHLFLHKASDE